MTDEYRPFLIGLNGFKGVGKDTVGQILIDNHDFKRLAFADSLKQAAATLLGINSPVVESMKNDPNVRVVLLRSGELFPRVIHQQTFRKFLQLFGTEVGRDLFGKDFWVDQILPYKELSTAYADNWYHGNRVITDARFPNELERIKSLGGFNIRIVRPGYGGENHASEQEPSDWMLDYIIENDGTIDDLKVKVDDVLSQAKYYQKVPT